ncbi:hypothetical protein PFICI_13404 [Pestalotiopsis fici W106-1]|uniref:Uncharacterized protein n=1 Tax=Pestalotiopsis fici (strain W106-1 / CGMCC3.15140) TaxID=1229662 RepID=W3WLW8_PESFW|nr:uncharacterized protein PFICI_13404 [Pestalotiopsis fici W106-1]ETS74920.1 hypothetical protein PFICI_13404 [Pestalotiopsis fici W106-1]
MQEPHPTNSVNLPQRSRTHESLTRSLTTQLLEDSEHRSHPQAWDPKRTTEWIRDLLKSRRSSTALTQSPKKHHPLQQSHHDYPYHGRGSPMSRVTTFSDQNAADADAMEQAMENLERLLSEALELANEVAEHDHAHLDDSFLEPPIPESPIAEDSQASSVHESLPQHSSADDIPSRLYAHSGNVRGPVLSSKPSSLTRQNKTSCEDPSLPLPPPDRDLKRDCKNSSRLAYDEDDSGTITRHRKGAVPNSREVREYIRIFHSPPITPRVGSQGIQNHTFPQVIATTCAVRDDIAARRRSTEMYSLDGGSDDIADFSPPTQHVQESSAPRKRNGFARHLKTHGVTKVPAEARISSKSKRSETLHNISLNGRSHISIQNANFSLTKSHRRQPIARD